MKFYFQVINILNACSLELTRNREKLDLPGPKDDVESLQVCMLPCIFNDVPNLVQLFLVYIVRRNMKVI